MSSLDSRLDQSLDDLIRQASQVKRPAVRAAAAKAAVAGSRNTGLVPKQVGGRAPASAATGAAGKRQAIRARRQAGTSSGGVAVAQRTAPKVLTVKAADLKRRGTAPVQGARALAKRIVNRAVMAPKQTATAALRQRGVSLQRPPVAVVASRPRQQQQPARQPRQRIAYVEPTVAPQQRQVPVSLARRMRQQRQQQQQQVAVLPAGRRGQRQAPVLQQGGQRGQQPQGQRIPVQRTVSVPRVQQQRQALGRVQQGGVRKNRQLQQPVQRRAPVYAGNASQGGRNGINQRGGRQQAQQQQVAAPAPRQKRGGGRNQQVVGGNQRQRAPILVQQNGRGGTGAGGRGRRGRR